MVERAPVSCMRQSLRYSPGRGNLFHHFVALCGGGLGEGTILLPGFLRFARHLPCFQSLHPIPVCNWHPSSCKNQWGLGQQKKLQDSQETPLKGLTKVSGLMQTYLSGIQHQVNSWKGTSSTQGESEVTGHSTSAGRQLPPGQISRGRQ